MAVLSLFQEIELNNAVDGKATFPAISGDALTLLVASSSKNVHVFKRESVSEQFVSSLTPYVGHMHSESITALSTQDNGVFAVSGDSSGSIHIWRTEDPGSNAKYKFHHGRVTSLSMTAKYVLVSFYNEILSTGKVLLLNKGLNLKEKLTVEKLYDENFSVCSISEYGRDRRPYVMYYSKDRFVFEDPVQEGAEKKQEFLLQAEVPWCLRRNNGTAPKHFVLCSIVLRNIYFWDPLHSSSPNLMICRLKSTESLRLNETVVISSVISSKMFLVSLYEKKIHIITLQRKILSEPPRFVKEPSSGGNKEEIDETKSYNTISSNDDEESGTGEQAVDNHVLKSVAAYVAKAIDNNDKGRELKSMESLLVKTPQVENENDDGRICVQGSLMRDEKVLENAVEDDSNTIESKESHPKQNHHNTEDYKHLQSHSNGHNAEGEESNLAKIEENQQDCSLETYCDPIVAHSAIPDRFWELFSVL